MSYKTRDYICVMVRSIKNNASLVTLVSYTYLI